MIKFLRILILKHITNNASNEIPALGVHGTGLHHPLRKPLVTGDDTVHWLCRTNSASYVLTRLVIEERVSSTKLPGGEVPSPLQLRLCQAGAHGPRIGVGRREPGRARRRQRQDNHVESAGGHDTV
jgi:hypothetical protein